MNPQKKSHLSRIRKDSAYPTFRLFIGAISTILYLVGIFSLLGGMWAGLAGKDSDERGGTTFFMYVGLGMIAVGLVSLVVGRVFKEVFLMSTDVADTLLDLHSRYEQ